MTSPAAPQPRRAKPSPLQHTLSSQCGSALSTVLLYPVDVLRVRFMSQDGTPGRRHNGQTYRSVLGSARAIYAAEGGGAFFRGCHVAVLGSVAAWGIYMYLYRQLLEGYTAQLAPLLAPADLTSGGKDSGGVSAALHHFTRRAGISILASAASAVACNPIWLLKTRMQIEEYGSRAAAAAGPPRPRCYPSFSRGLAYAVRTAGVLSLWRGVSAQVLLSVPNAFNLPLYETLKLHLTAAARGEPLTLWEIFLCSTSAKMILSVFTHPIAVLKTRMQDYRALHGDVQYRRFVQSFNLAWRRGGVWDLYRGIVPSIIHSTPRSVLLYVFYEQFCKIFSKVID
ncbi:unnamed protein product [Phytomonas sp. Hart1]|nr:unnamed protein product [Phytomonas sp. Hart1]|eukprot:CCW70607.1 unnamed protein product [Phytomonas sp. isolate Hart1]